MTELEYVSVSNTELSGLSAILLDQGSRRYPWFKSLLLYLYAQVRNWKTSMTQTHVPIWVYGFDSRPGYFAVMPQLVMGRS